MAGILSSTYSVFLVATESAVGTDAVDAAITANENITYQAFNAGTTIVPQPLYERQPVARPGIAGVRHVQVNAHSDVNVVLPLREGVGTDFEPEYAVIWEAAGFGKETNSGTSTVFTEETANDSFCTIYKYQRNVSNNNWRLRRAVATLLGLDSISGEVGAEPVATFVGKCASHADWTVDRAYFDSDDEPTLDFEGSSYTYTGTASASAADPFICENMTITYNSVNLPVQSFNLAGNYRVEPNNDMLTADTIAARIVRDRPDGSNMVLSVNLAMTDSGTLGAAFDDILSAYTASEEAAFQLRLDNGTSRITIDLPAVQPRLPAESPNNGAMNFDIEFHVNGDYSSAPFADNAVVVTYDASP